MKLKMGQIRKVQMDFSKYIAVLLYCKRMRVVSKGGVYILYENSEV